MISQANLSLSVVCETLGVSRRNFYRGKKQITINSEDIRIKKVIEKVIKQFPGYGYRRVTKAIQREGEIINHKRIYRIMAKNNIVVKKKKFKVITTNSNHNLPVFKNLIKNLELTKLNQLWVADLTYIKMLRCHIYLAAILDRFSRRCVGWALSKNIDTDLVLEALDMAIKKRKHLGFTGLIHHSDRGVQYASKAYVNMLKELNVEISMSRKGNPYDNAHMESFMKTFKIEEVYIKEYETFEEAYLNVKQFIEVVYNKKRLHSGIGYLPPNEFEKEVLNKAG